MQIKKASLAEKKQYTEQTYPVHPLHGWLQIGSHRCAVEYLGEGKDNPNYEVMAPKGYQFICNGTHSILGRTLIDLCEQVECDDLVACASDCHCKEKSDDRN